PQLAMTISGEEVDDAIQRLVSVVGVERTQTQVAGFRERNSVVHGFAGAHLANQYDVGRLSQRVFQSNFKGIGINSHFALRNDAALVLVDKFNRVFDGNNVALGVMVAMA